MVIVYLVIACGLGALVRYFFSRYNQASKLPLGTLIANLLGCFLIGLFYNHVESKEVYAMLATGFCGGLTTFSTLNDELQWMVGLLGLIPIYLGIRFAIVGEGEEEEEEIIERLEQSKANQLFWTVTLLTIASGGDNLGIYIPYFASLDWSQTLVALLVFVIGIIILCEISRVLSSIPLIFETIEKYERIIVPLVFILLGIYIMYENGTIETFLTV